MAEKKAAAKAAEEKATKAVEEIKEAAPAVEAPKEEAPKAEAPKEEAPKAVKKPAAKKTAAKKAAAKTTKAAKEEDSEKKEEAPKAAKKTTTRKTTAKKTTKKAAAKKVEAPAAEESVAAMNPAAEKIKEGLAPVIEEAKVEAEAPAEEIKAEAAPAEEIAAEAPAAEEAPEVNPLPEPRRSIAFIGSECYPFVKTGGLGDVMYALPKALVAQNCDVKVILPRYKCIPQKYQEKMVYRGAFHMDLCADGRTYYVGIMEYVWDGVVYDFIDNEEFFSVGKPYTNLIDDIPKYCYFGKAALAALNYMDWIPDVIHCHDWQAGLVPVYLRTMFDNTPIARAKVMITIHNLKFQGIYNIPTIKYWSGLPDYVFNKDALKQGYDDANMFKGGLAYSNMITTVSGTYAQEIQTPFYGENLDAHLRYHSGKLHGIVNGIDYGMWDPSTDKLLAAPYDVTDVIEKKKKNKLAMQESLGLEQDENKFVIGLISRLTDQKGLDLVNAIVPQLMDGNTQVVVLGTGDAVYEDSFRYYENAYKGSFCAYIAYDESLAHGIYAGSDAFFVPSRFEPCGLTQLIAMHYGTVPIVRETGGLKDTVEPFNQYTGEGNGFTFDRYESGLLLDATNRAKTIYFEHREAWDEIVKRNMNKDVSWEVSAKQYRQLYVEMTQ
ncbi:MAG: glycogen synthase [Lachnospiraceae bacterium]|nr:glycogen synthase [Lachnospiraceae bacterium]